LLGASALAHGTSHELIEAASLAIAEKPEDAARYLRRAQLHLEHGDCNACLLDLADAERRQTEDLGAGLLRGRALAAGGRFAEAKVTLDIFLAAHPDHAAALMQRARALGALERNAEAAEDFVRAMALTPHPEPDHVFELADLLCRAGRHADALAAIDRALKATPGVPSLVERAVKIETACGNFDGAVRRIADAMQSVDVKEPLMARRATLLAQAGRIAESVAAWRELQLRIAAMPEAARDSHAMSSLALRTRHALAALSEAQP
jgi:tetratricopeptide (TPR) repeat protein